MVLRKGRGEQDEGEGKIQARRVFSPRSAPQSEALSANNRALDGKQRKIGHRKWPGHHVCISRLQLPKRSVVASSRSSRSKSLHPGYEGIEHVSEFHAYLWRGIRA